MGDRSHFPVNGRKKYLLPEASPCGLIAASRGGHSSRSSRSGQVPTSPTPPGVSLIYPSDYFISPIKFLSYGTCPYSWTLLFIPATLTLWQRSQFGTNHIAPIHAHLRVAHRHAEPGNEVIDIQYTKRGVWNLSYLGNAIGSRSLITYLDTIPLRICRRMYR